jgi:hypothetical protein
MSNQSVISVGLWGNNPKYIIGLMRLSFQVKNRLISPNQIFCFISPDTYLLLKTEYNWHTFCNHCFGSHLKFIIMHAKPGWHSTLWRYSLLKLFLNNSPLLGINHGFIVHFRDLDSIIYHREDQLVNHWINTKMPYLSIKDHPSHDSWPIMAGLFSVNTNELNRCEIQDLWKTLIRAIPKEELYFSDQIALKHFHKTLASNKLFVYRGHCQPPTPRAAKDYIGEPIGCDLSTDLPGRWLRADYIANLALS